MKQGYKQGYMKTVEAIMAVFITFLFVLYYFPTHTETESRAPSLNILPVLEKNDDFRKCVIEGNMSCLNETVESILPGNYNYLINISENPNTEVTGLPADKRVYADSVYLVGNETEYKPRTIKLYYWGKG